MPNKKQKLITIVSIDEDATTIAVQNGDQIMYSNRLMVNTKAMDEAITRFFSEELGLLIGKRTAKAVRTEVGSAFRQETPLKMRVRGRAIKSNALEDVIITDEQIRRAIAGSVKDIVNGAQTALKQMPLEREPAVADYALLLCGEGSKLRGLDRLLSQEIDLPVTIVYK